MRDATRIKESPSLLNSPSNPFAVGIILSFYPHEVSGTSSVGLEVLGREGGRRRRPGRGGCCDRKARGTRNPAEERPRGAGCCWCGGRAALPRAGSSEPAGTPRAGRFPDRRAWLRGGRHRPGPARAGRGRRAHRLRPAAPLPGDAPGAGRIGGVSGSSRCLGASATSESGSLSLSAARSRGCGGRRRQGTGWLMRVGVCGYSTRLEVPVCPFFSFSQTTVL